MSENGFQSESVSSFGPVACRGGVELGVGLGVGELALALGMCSCSGSDGFACTSGLVLFDLFLFTLLWSKCPLMVAMECGGYLARVSLVRPGKPMRKSLRRAAASVVRGGLKRVAWLNATMSAGLVDWLTAIAAYMVSSAPSIVSVSGRLICQSLGACLLLFPLSMVLPLRLIVASVLVKMATQSASHSRPMLTRCVSPSSGKMSVRVASAGRLGRLRWAV
jgi:hypothetical protein